MEQSEEDQVVVRWASDGSVMVIMPDGQTKFMSFLEYPVFVWRMLWAGKRIHVADNIQS